MNSLRLEPPRSVPLAASARAVPLARVADPELPSRAPRSRLWALVPLAAVGLWPLVPWMNGLEIALLIATALLGSFAGWRARSRSARDGWQRAFPGVSFARVRAFPRSDESVRCLALVCVEVSRGLDEERSLRGGLGGWWRGRPVRRQLQALPRHAAALAVQLERLADLDDPRVLKRRHALQEQLDAAVPLARRLRTSSARATPDLLDRHALRALDEAERAWSAELDSADELTLLEASP